MNYDTKGLVEKLCEARGVSVADLLRSLVRRELANHDYLGEEVARATSKIFFYKLSDRKATRILSHIHAVETIKL